MSIISKTQDFFKQISSRGSNLASSYINNVAKPMAAGVPQVQNLANSYTQSVAKPLANFGNALVNSGLVGFNTNPGVLGVNATTQGMQPKPSYGIKPIENFNKGVQTYLQNRYVQPVLDLPKNTSAMFDSKKNWMERGAGALGTLGGVATFLPDPIQDFGLPVYDTLKGYSASSIRGGDFKQNLQSAGKALTMENPIGLGTAATTNPTGEMIGNLAELPLMLGLTAKIGKGQNFGYDKKIVSQFRDVVLQDKDARGAIQRFATMVETSSQPNKLNTGETGRMIQAIVDDLFGSKKAGNLTNTQIKNLLDVLYAQAGDQSLFTNRKFIGMSTQDVREGVSNSEEYLKELVGKQKEARSVNAGSLGTKINSFLSDVKAKLVDETAPIQDVLTTAEKKGNFQVLPKNDIRLQIDRVLRSKNLASQFAEDNGLVDVIRKAPNLDALDQYMIAKQAQKVGSLGIKTGRDSARDRQLIQDLAPQYEGLAQQVNQYSRKLLQYSVDSGLISPELAKELIKKYPEYVPLQRIFSELEQPRVRGTGRGVASLSSQSVVQKIKGSEREIASPIESLLIKTQDAFNQGERNIAGKQLASYRNLPGFNGLIKETSAGSKAPHTFSFIESGVKKTFATTPEIEAAAKALNVEQMGLLGKILSVPTRVLQLGATGLNIPFVLTNMLKDEITGFVNSNRAARTSLLNPANYIKALFSAVKHDELYKEVVRSAAGGTSFDIAREAPNLTVQQIRSGRNLTSKVVYIARNPLELLRAVENVVGKGEELGRVKNYSGTKEALLSEGRTAQDANLLAAKAARENTANFARRGSWGRVLNWVIPFFNAGIQGARQLVTSVSTRPIETGAKIAMTIFTPIAVTTAWNLSDPERKSIYQDIPEWEKETSLIIIPPNATQDAKGRWNVIKVPLPPGLSNLGSIVRRSIESTQGLDPVRFGEIATNLITAGTSIDISSPNKIASTFTPQIAKPVVEGVTNTNLYTGQKIVPDYLKNKLPSEQFKATTPKSAKVLGKALNVSPLVIENFAQSQLGGLGSQLLGKESPAGNIERRFSKATSGAIVDEIYTNAEKYSALDTQIKDLVKSGKINEAKQVVLANKKFLQKGLIVNEFQNKISEMYSDRNKVLNSNLPEDKKQQILLVIQQRITQLNRSYLNFKSQQGGV